MHLIRMRCSIIMSAIEVVVAEGRNEGLLGIHPAILHQAEDFGSTAKEFI